MFELQGLIKELPKADDTPADKKGAKDKKGNKKKKAGKKGKAPKVEKYSNQLNETEKFSFENFFQLKNEDQYFDIFSADGNKLDIKANGTKDIKLCFGIPEILAKKKAEFIRKLNEKKKKGKKQKGGKKSKGSKSTGSKKSNENRIYYAAKYNFMLNNVFVKDVILICAFIGK